MYRSQKSPINTEKTGHSKGPKMAFTPQFTPLNTFYQSAGRAPPVISIVIISDGVFLLGRYQGSAAEGSRPSGGRHKEIVGAIRRKVWTCCRSGARLSASLPCDACDGSQEHKGEGAGKIKRPPGFHFRRRPKHDRAGQVVFIKTENLSFFRPWKTEDRGRGCKKAAALSWIKAAHEYFRL